MSRRFRDPPPPPVTASPKYVHTPSRASSASVPRSARFVAPSSTSQHPASTPGPTTSISRFRDKPRVRDEIETSFEEEADAPSSTAAPRSRLTSSKISTHREIDELPSDEENDNPAPVALVNGRRNLTTNLEDNNDNDSLADLEFLESLRGTTSTRGPNIDSFPSSSSSSYSDADSPLPTATASTSRKRRRLDNRTDHDFNTIDGQIEHNHEHEAIINSKSVNYDDDNNNSQPSSDLSLPSSPLPRRTMTSRFKPPPPASFNKPTTPQLPTSITQTTKRPSFRPPPDQSQSPSHLDHLPPAFSPSHRRGKGKVDCYVPDGAADTVRNWILGLSLSAAEGGVGSRSLNRGHRHGGASKGKEEGLGLERVRVAEVMTRDDALGGRFVLVRGLGADREEDGDDDDRMEKRRGEGLCLIHPHADGPTRTRSRRLKGKVVDVRMGWDIDLHSPLKGSGLGKEDDEGGNGNPDGDEHVTGNGKTEVWKVGVLWDVLDP